MASYADEYLMYASKKAGTDDPCSLTVYDPDQQKQIKEVKTDDDCLISTFPGKIINIDDKIIMFNG